MKKLVVVIFILALGTQGVMSENDASGNDCFVPAVCNKPGYSETAWMSISRPVCEANTTIKGIQGEMGLKGESGPAGQRGEDGPQGEVGPPGPKGDNGTRGIKGNTGEVGVNGTKGESGSQGEIGQPGPKGDDGTRGEKGSSGEAVRGEKGIKGGIGPKGDPASVDSLAIGNIINVLCPVAHGNKCFFTVVGRAVNYTDGVATCDKRLGAQLANIYNQTHMDDVIKYIRENRMNGSSLEDFRLGMKYDPEAKKLTLRDGTDAAADLKWFSGTPYTVESTGDSVADHTNVILRVVNNQSSIYQYLHNMPPAYELNVLCEIE